MKPDLLRLVPFLRYVLNTNGGATPANFADDFAPIGGKVWAELVALGLVRVDAQDRIHLAFLPPFEAMAVPDVSTPGDAVEARLERGARLAGAMARLPAGEPRGELVAAIVAAVREYFAADEMEAADALLDLLPDTMARGLWAEYSPAGAVIRFGGKYR